MAHEADLDVRLGWFDGLLEHAQKGAHKFATKVLSVWRAEALPVSRLNERAATPLGVFGLAGDPSS